MTLDALGGYGALWESRARKRLGAGSRGVRLVHSTPPFGFALRPFARLRSNKGERGSARWTTCRRFGLALPTGGG